MNHIYKVIWNKAKHCYTVVSEITKNHSHSNKRVRSMTAVVAAAMMLTGFGGMAIEAVNLASDDTNITIGKNANFAIWNNVTGHDKLTSGYISIGENAYAWDGEYPYKDKYARIGTKEYMLDFKQGAVGGAESIFGIPYKYRVTDGTKLAGAIAIGKNTMARTGSVTVGDYTYVGKLGDIEVDPKNRMTLNNGVYSTTLGASSYNSGSMSSVTGAFSIISHKEDEHNRYETQNFGATVYGSLNSIESSSVSNGAAGMANSVLGFGNKTQNTNASLVWGTGNEVTNSIEKVKLNNPNWNQVSASGAQKQIIEAMQSSDYAGGSVMAIGGGNKADWATYSQLLGVQNKLTGTEQDGSKLAMINGYKNTVANAKNTTIIGSSNKATNVKSTIIMGDENTLKGRQGVISLGNKNTIEADDAVAIGNGTTVTAENGVAIGVGSVADRVAGNEKGVVGAFAPEKIDATNQSTWTSTAGAVSVGDTVNNITRQITNVAAGSEDTDAVNVAQLKQVNSKADSATEMANKGWNLTTGVVTDATQVKPGDTVDFSGDKNISVSHNETDVSIALKDTLTLGSNTTVDYVTVDGVKGTVWAGHAVSAGNVNMDGDSGEITGLTNTTLNSKDFATTGRAATEEQLKLVKNQADSAATEASKHSKVVNGSNITVEETDQDGQKTYKVGLNKDILLGDITGKNVSISGTMGTIETTGYIATKDLIIADKGAQLADITVSGNAISNGEAKVALDGAAGTAGMINGKGASINMQDGYTVINSKVAFDQNGKISGVAAGTADTDAVNVSQLKNSAWKLAANGVLTEAEDVKADDYVDFNGDQNVSVSKDAKDGVKTVKVELNKDLKDIESISNGDAKMALNGAAGTAGMINGKGASIYMKDGYTVINSKVAFDQNGKISGVAAGVADTDAVNVSQLKAVGATANMGWNLATNGVATEATNVKPGDFVDFSGDKNISVSHDGTKVKVELNKDIDVNSVQTNALNSKYNLSVGTMAENGIMPFFVNSTGDFYAAHNKFHVDKDGKVTATAGEIGNVVLQNGVYYGHSTLQDGSLLLTDDNGNHSYIDAKGAKLGKVTVAEDGKISGVAAGAVTADSTDAVNGSQLHEVATEAGKHSKVVNGSNINVEETDVDGQKIYKVGLNDDILLGKLTGNNVSISGTNGTIETTGYIATKDRIIADKGAQLADITVSGNAISNGEAKVALDGAAGTAGMINGKGASLYMQDGTTVINNKVGIDQEGKITGVAAGEISATSKDAVNGSQLKQTNDKVDALDKRVTQNEADIKQNKADIAQNKADIAQNKADIQKNTVAIEQNKTDIATNKENINKLDTRVTNVEELAKKHTTVAAGDNITVTEGTNKDGGKNYTVAMKKDITVDSVKAGDTTINTEGVRIGDTTSLKKDSLTIGGKTYVTDKGLNANNQTITNVADGKVEKGSKDAINGSQLFATNQQVAQNAQSISKLGNRINKVGAGAAALAALHPLDFDPDDKWDFAAGYGNYNGENAAAIGAYYRPNEDTMFSVGGSFGNGENMVNAGVSLKLGQGNHVSTSKVAMAKEIKDLRKELEGLKSALLDVNAGKKLDTSKLQLFPDVPKNHWAYEYVSTLKGNGVLTGYPDGEFKGDRPMTRYEFATMLYKAMLEGATLSDKILKEFAPELERFTVDTVHQDKDGKPTVERVRTVKAEK